VASLDDPAFRPPAALALPAGASEYRQKGNAYLGDRPWLDQCVQGGFATAVAALPDAGARSFLSQPFKASEWYDAYPGALLESTAATMRGVPFARHRRETGAFHARHAMHGVYGSLLRLISNESVAVWGPRISALFFDFGKTQTRVEASRSVAASRSGIPADLVQWTAYAMAGFAEGALQIAGAHEARCVLTDVVECGGGAFGRPLYQIDMSMTWR
jgi:hypothetical protein